MAIGDLDGDGKPDLAVVTQLADHLSIFKNISTPGSFTTGSLAPRVDYPTGWNPNGVAIGDLDGDGRPDIAFAVYYAATLSIYQNQTPRLRPAPGTNPPAITSITPTIATPGNTVTIFGNNFSPMAASQHRLFRRGAGDGFVRQSDESDGDGSRRRDVCAGHRNGRRIDGVFGQMFEPTFAGNSSNITTSSFAPSFTLPGASGPQSMIIADLDGDGKPDIAFVNGYTNVISIYRNISTNGAPLSAASFAPRLDLLMPSNATGNPYRLRAADLDGDGRLDLIAATVGGTTIAVFHNVSTPGNLTTSSFEAPFTLTAGNDCRNLAVGDLDADGRPDILVLNSPTTPFPFSRTSARPEF